MSSLYFGVDTIDVKLADAGLLLPDTLRTTCTAHRVDNYLPTLDMNRKHILALVKVETLPQHSVSKLAPVGEELAGDFSKILCCIIP